MSALHSWIAIVAGTIGVISSFLTLSKWVKRCWKVLSKIYNMALVFFGEHELLMSDYCLRHGIIRHNAHNLAKAIAEGSEWRANGEAKKSKAAAGGTDG